jgi:hypothetical protein
MVTENPFQLPAKTTLDEDSPYVKLFFSIVNLDI